MKRQLYNIGFALALLCVYAFCMAGIEQPAIPNVVSASLELPTYTVSPTFTAAEERCVQRMVFGEARNQTHATQVAVAATVVNRSLSGTYPNELCKVVAQTGQYKGYVRSITLPNDSEALAWDNAGKATSEALNGYGALPAEYRQALYFHESNGKLNWSNQYKLLGRLDKLVFYGSSSA